MASIRAVTTYLDAAEQQIATLRERDPNAESVSALTSLHAAVAELAAIVRSDRV
ncbi:hypothetical protein [Microbacterium sp. 2FI]|uniref:hypothetical protein n=1 Tax=Microbacterium sp. 2FI TaxID=2502193 RepID=UPI001485C310|nr:hypothetical protein [Microbacterium sp. 2FI]